MIVVEIQDPADGRASHEIGPFPNPIDAAKWAAEFVKRAEYDEDFVEVHHINHRIYDPYSLEDMDEVDSYYGL